MANIEALKEKISDTGMPISTLAKRAGITRGTLYNRLAGVGEFTASEIMGITSSLKLTRTERERIFFN